MRPDGPPRVGLGLIKRALVAALLIPLVCAAAVASAALLTVDDVLQVINEEGGEPIRLAEIDRAEVGKPQTLMILGSDQRYGDEELGIKPRSDTIILVRLDPDNDAIAMMSLPRDLKVTIPGNSVPTKINAAYEQGGPQLTLKTVKQELSTRDQSFKINHVVQLDFGGFRRAIDYIGCVYYDVDRRYFNDNSAGENYATIDIKPGYQKLCGRDALDYVRHRHSDNDLVRAARQQDFLRQMKNQRGIERLKDPRRIKRLARIFARYTDSDAGLRDKRQLFSLAKLAIFASDKPVREVPFEIDGEEQNGAYLVASESTVRKTVSRFMAAGGRRPGPEPTPTPKPGRRPPSGGSLADVPDLVDARREGEDQALLARRKVDLPVYFPTRKHEAATLDGGLSSEPTTRTYSIRDEAGTARDAYRMTYKIFTGGFGEYYGVQGTTWRDPPLLDGPDETRVIDGRPFQLHYDGRRLRLVAWKTKRASYWVSNTLTRRLSNRQMLAVAASLDRLGPR